MKKTMNRTLLDGSKYEFVEYEMFGHSTVTTYCEWDGKMHHIGLSFHNLEEAAAWCDKKDNEFLNPKPVKKNDYSVPADYYLERERYFGD